MKHCAKCQQSKPEQEFWKNSSCEDGLQAYCKQCQSLLLKQFKERDPERVRKTDRESYARHKDDVKERRRTRRIQENKGE